MKISNSKKQLAKIIHENGGWQDGVRFAAQDKHSWGGDNRIVFYTSKPTKPAKGCDFWRGLNTGYAYSIVCAGLLYNWHQTLLSRDEYFHLYQAPETEPEPVVEAKPTIEQLAADYRNRKYYADRKQQEADAAKADSEEKLAELVAAGKELGLVLSVAPTQKYTDRFYNAELGGHPEYSDEVHMCICENCGNRFGLHYEDESYCKPRSERENA